MPPKENLPEGYLSEYVVRIKDRKVHLPRGGKPPPTTSKALPCPVCGCPWSFNNLHKLKVHGDMHLTLKQIEERMIECKNPGCQFATLKQGNLVNHQKQWVARLCIAFFLALLTYIVSCGKPKGAPKIATKPKRTRAKGPPLESRRMQTPSTASFESEYSGIGSSEEPTTTSIEGAASSSYPAGREILSSMTGSHSISGSASERGDTVGPDISSTLAPAASNSTASAEYSSHKFVYYVPSSHPASGSSGPLTKLLYPGNPDEARASRKMYCGSCGRGKRCA
ncbi:hypothetical protein FB45DRAFT_1106850 [Roridomyces roridus]|uniref:C2H2-type domain-containing protein n=1 Tax=Roridomyces roridus TaxID=1738132 RepID=A0AAD7BBC3_9AGAR|nr:hypothetical protein FB45DRAFT_1106850 [Roridomyces roridus]